ncbi:MAG: hypothetical protein ABIT76_02530 [Chthoniobacterales bacterium]
MTKKRRLLLIVGGQIIFWCTMWFSIHQGTQRQRMEEKNPPSARPVAIPFGTAVRSRMIEADPAETRLSAKDNAANDYRRAFALLEKLTKREKDMMSYRAVLKEEPSAVEVEALLTKIEPIIALLREGAAKPACDWRLHDLRTLTTTTHMSKAWDLAQIAFWDAKQRVHDQPNSSVADVRALNQLSNSMDAGTGSSLNHLGTQALISQFIKDWAAELPAQDRRELLTMWIQPDFLAVAQSCNRSEIETNLQLIDLYKSGVDFEGKPLSEWTKRMGAGLFGSDSATQKRTRKGFEKLARVADESVFWSDEKFDQWCQQVADMPTWEDGSNPIQTFAGIRRDLRTSLRQRAMTAAGLALMDEGMAALARFPDPLNGETFQYRVMDDQNAFQLQSTVLHKGKPVSLTFRRGEKGTTTAP